MLKTLTTLLLAEWAAWCFSIELIDWNLQACLLLWPKLYLRFLQPGPSLEVKGRCVPSENNLFRFPQVGSMLILTRYHREDKVPQERN